MFKGIKRNDSVFNEAIQMIQGHWIKISNSCEKSRDKETLEKWVISVKFDILNWRKVEFEAWKDAQKKTPSKLWSPATLESLPLNNFLHGLWVPWVPVNQFQLRKFSVISDYRDESKEMNYVNPYLAI